MSQFQNSAVPGLNPQAETQAAPTQNSDPRQALNQAVLAWEEAKQTLDKAYSVFEPLRRLRQSDQPFTGDWWRFTYLPALEHVLWAIENEKAFRSAYEEVEQTYRWSNQGLDDFADSFELTNDWRSEF